MTALDLAVWSLLLFGRLLFVFFLAPLTRRLLSKQRATRD